MALRDPSDVAELRRRHAHHLHALALMPFVVGASWSPTFKNAHVVPSNNNLTVATDGVLSFTHEAGRGTPVILSGAKKRFEVTINALGPTNTAGIGLANASETFADNAYLGSQAAGLGYYDTGEVYFNNAVLTTLTPFSAGNVIGVDTDRVNSKVWFSVNGVYFGADNPATNTGGLSIAGLGDVYPAYNVRDAGKSTANFGATAFAFATPSGFSKLS